MHLCYILGASNAGKTTLIKQLEEAGLSLASIRVGEEMRKRHPPSFFQGQGAPEKTRKEAWEVFSSGFLQHAGSVDYILVDGQPRRIEETEQLIGTEARIGAWALAEIPRTFIYLHADQQTLVGRCCERFQVSPGIQDLLTAGKWSPADLLRSAGQALDDQLISSDVYYNICRVVNDPIALLPILLRLYRGGEIFRQLDSTDEGLFDSALSFLLTLRT